MTKAAGFYQSTTLQDLISQKTVKFIVTAVENSPEYRNIPLKIQPEGRSPCGK